MTSNIFNVNYVEVRNQKPQESHTLEVFGYISNESQAQNELFQKYNTTMKTKTYVQQTWASRKFFSQA